MQTYNLNIQSCAPLITPRQLKAKLPINSALEERVLRWRKTIENILDGTDTRKIFIIGPCSIHDIQEAREYAVRLKSLADKVQDKISIVIRAYFEKPITGPDWKGLLNDPDLNETYNIEKGVSLAREFLLFLAETGIPAATEALDPLIPPYYSDLITYSSIGARTIASQIHKDMASGLSAPVGLKNTEEGDIEKPISGISYICRPHHFLGQDQEGRVCVVHTRGNLYGHLVLRGGRTPNYDAVSVRRAHESLLAKKVRGSIVIDCSHGNSGKDYRYQPDVLRHVVDQMRNSHNYIVGAMLESNLLEGNQKFVPGTKPEQGISITDSCISFKTTEQIVLEAYHLLP